MKTRSVALLVVAAVAAGIGGACAQTGIERLYIIDCGQSVGPDKSRWTPGVDVGKPVEMVGNCYLIRHARGLLLWDTGVTDEIAKLPDGRPGTDGSPHWRRSKTLAGELDKLGVKPSDITYLAISHTHPDHVGNVELFPQSMLLVQKAEYDWPSPQGPRFKPTHPVTKLEGDHDVFGDGTATIYSTPGHTPGHQVLMVKLSKSGAILLTGDAIHFQENWDKRHIPSNNVDREKTLTSYQRISDLLTQHKAQLWFNHDKQQSERLRKAPEFYE